MRIGIVEDDNTYRGMLADFVRQYGEEQNIAFEVSLFTDGLEMITDYKPEYDIILLDIEMPNLDGMQTAQQIRAKDADVVLIFVTNMTQYAIHGYSVRAFDYVLKPISYYQFSVKLARAIDLVNQRASGQITLMLADGMVRLKTRQIYYVDIQNRQLHYHTELGEFVIRGTLQSAEDELSKYHFVRCNHWYLVNLAHVDQVREDTAVVAGNELEISRRNRKAFLKALTDYLGGGV